MDWKSTAGGILTGLIATFGGIMTYQVPMALLNPQQAHTWLWIVVGCQLATIVAKAWLGVITKNADAAAVAGALNNVADVGPGAALVTPAILATTPKVNQ